MPPSNRDRVLVSLLREIAAEQELDLSSFSQDWILRLEKGGQARHIFGYNFEINSATAQLIAGDKAAISDLLTHRGTPVVEHKLFLQPALSGYVSADGNWAAMRAYAEAHDFSLVCKPNEGTGGLGVSHVHNAVELENAVHQLFKSNRAIALSPYLDIELEYRVIVLDDVCELIYSKQRPQVVGDGQSTVLELIESLQLDGFFSQETAAQAVESLQGNLKQVPEAGQQFILGWKHNLGAGAMPLIIEDGPLHDELCELARAAQEAINIRFASIDIVRAGGQLMVLEINSGIMMEFFSQHAENGLEIAKGVYAQAVAKMFEA
jgi:glutathione synthase/RimK-type ligase-like ATP-grasp enzyme